MITVVTVTLNAAKALPGCLESVAAQDGVELEHLVVDGGSTDGTCDLLRRWNAHPVAWSSEPDYGISHAFNKGIARARGDLIALLNADDRYTPGALARAIAALADTPEAGFAYGHCLHRELNGHTWLNLADPRYAQHMRYFMPDINHPTMVVRRSAYAIAGLYDQHLRYAMDYDWLLRAHDLGIRGVLVPSIQAEMAMGGISDRGWRTAYAEANQIAIRHGAPRFMAWIDLSGRITKGTMRRLLATCGAKRLETIFRRWRQRRRLGADYCSKQVLPPF